MKRMLCYLPMLVIAMLLCGCNGTEKLLKSNDIDEKFEAAMKYYNDNSYSRAAQLFENLTLHYRGRDHAEDIAWYYGKCMMAEGDYYLAAYQFQTFAHRFPYSARAEEAAFLSAKCKYQESPEYSLDQTLTKEAVADFELFAEHYPNSNHLPEVNDCLDELRQKLMLKDYEIAYNYYVVESYHAAYVSLNNFLNLYPDSPKREEAMYYLIRSGYEYAINSREDKVKERLQLVVNDFDKFATTFKNSRYLSTCQSIYTKSKARLAEIEQAALQPQAEK